MILELILTALFEVLASVTSLVAGIIPGFPEGFNTLASQVTSAMISGASVVLYFFDVSYIKALLGMVLTYWISLRAYNLVLKILSRLHILSGSEDEGA